MEAAKTMAAAHPNPEAAPIISEVASKENPSIVAIIGSGYVGFQLALEFGAHYQTIAYDISPSRVQELEILFQSHPRISPTCDPKRLNKATHFLISVPTLVLPDNNIDTTALASAIKTVAEFGNPGVTVVVESSVAVGMTRSLLSNLIKLHGVKGGMSPERVDPGRVSPSYVEIPKIISGLDDLAPGSLDSITKLYSKVFSSLVPVSSPEVAEMTKLYENCQRMVCIAYVNELADACEEIGISPYEVSQAAATKPFGYMAYTPSLGVGGHCIPVNPYYLFASATGTQATATDAVARLEDPATALEDALNATATENLRTSPSSDSISAASTTCSCLSDSSSPTGLTGGSSTTSMTSTKFDLGLLDSRQSKCGNDTSNGTLATNSHFPLLRLATERMKKRPGIIADKLMKRLLNSAEWCAGVLARQLREQQQKQEQDSSSDSECSVDTDDAMQLRTGSGNGGDQTTCNKIRPRMLVVGVGFKPGQAVLSNSPAVALMKQMQQRWGADVYYADPLVKQTSLPQFKRIDHIQQWNRLYIETHFDLVVVAMKQHGLDFDVLKQIQASNGSTTKVHYCCSLL